jgi:signal peptidase II
MNSGSSTVVISNGARRRCRPLLLTGGIIAADQIVKMLIVQSIELHTVGASFWGGFLRIIHTRNLAIAFSLGSGLPEQLRTVLFVMLPLLLLALLLYYLLGTDEFTAPQRWAVGAIIGGGIGNQIDRILRPSGVVDFIDVKFYGLFGLERWPTFNIADASVVVGGILLMVTLLLEGRRKGKGDE